jgi:hypothetical protein
MTAYDEERIAHLLRLLPPAPDGWVRAAQELPAARAAVGDLVARAEADALFRARLLADLEGAVASAGYEPTPHVIAQLRRILTPD